MSLSWQVLSSPFDVTAKPRTDLSRHYDDRKKFKKGRLLLENDGKSANNIMVDSRVVRRSIFASNGTNSLARYTSHSKGGGGGGSTVGFGRGGVVNNANSGKQQRQQNQQQQPHYQQQSSNGCILFDSRLIKGNIFANPIITVTKTIPNEEHLQEKEKNRHQQPNTKSMVSGILRLFSFWNVCVKN